MTEAIPERPITPSGGTRVPSPTGGYQWPANPSTDPDLYIKVVIPKDLYEGRPAALEFELSKAVNFDVDVQFKLLPIGSQTSEFQIGGFTSDFTFITSIRIPASSTRT